ncbi:MAG: DUF4842 domain-containing protein [Bacteroidaceae bacterium]|nr:DUF4842 domain-containing protein [Bacteroidaceae bacterium]
MKKSLLLFAASALFMASCTQEDLSKGKNETSKWYENVNVDLENIVPTRSVEIPVPAGKGAIVLSNNGDTLSVIDKTRSIDIPASLYVGNNATRATESQEPAKYKNYAIEIKYIDLEDINLYGPKDFYYEVVAFEDLNADDYDYNDLIFHSVLSFSADRMTRLRIQPIALGAKNTIDLTIKFFKTDKEGSVISKLQEVTIKDVRKSLFKDNTKDFINTDSATIASNGGLTAYPFAYDKGLWFNDPSIEYIDVVYSIYVHETGKTYTSVPMTQRLASSIPSEGREFNTSFDRNNIPFGLVFSDIYGGKIFQSDHPCGADWWIYPTERTDIQTVYPNFREWLEGEHATFDWSSPIGNYVNAIGDYNEISIYEYNLVKEPTFVSRQNPFKFDLKSYTERFGK